MILRIVLLISATASVASANGVEPFELPAGPILEAAREIQPQTGPAYQVKGALQCRMIAREMPPYETTSVCLLKVRGRVTRIKDVQPLLAALSAKIPPQGPVYVVTGRLTAQVVSREVPPYDVAERVLFLPVRKGQSQGQMR